jgi:hypothetical protein
MTADFIKKMQFVHDSLCDEKSKEIILKQIMKPFYMRLCRFLCNQKSV